ncbi:MAG: hypothetical protein QJR09_05150 [Micrococcus sp.]|nr:hypothetical protein [Micrococcus sp.]
MKAQNIKAGQTFYSEDGFELHENTAAQDATTDGTFVTIVCTDGEFYADHDTELELVQPQPEDTAATTSAQEFIAKAYEDARATLHAAWTAGYAAGVRDEARDLEGTSAAAVSPYRKVTL